MGSVDNFILALLSKCKSLVTLRQIHAFVMKTGLDSDSVVAGKLLLHCAVTVSDALEYCRRLFLHFPYPDVFMYNTLIRGFSESDSPRNAFGLFVEMRRESMAPPDSFSFAFLFKAAANFKALRIGLQLHRQAVGYGMDNHLFVSTTLISMYAECGCVGSAKKVFEEILDPNVVAWNAVVTAYFRCEDLKGAQKMFDQIPVRNLTSWNIMLSGYTKAGKLELARKAFFNMPLKDDVSWSTMIVGFAHNGFFDDAFEFFRELLHFGTGVNEVSLTGVFSACALAGAFEFGKLLHCFVEKIGYLHFTSVNNALIDAYSKCGNVAMAQLVFEKMPGKKSIVTWTAMIAGLAMQGHGKEAIELFHEMQENGIRPDGIAFISILYACSHAGLIEDGWKYFSCMKCVYGLEPCIEHYGCMVDLCGRAGQLQKAFEFVCQMPISPNAVIWRTLLGACNIHGNLKLAEKVKERLYELDPKDSGDHVLLSNLYAAAGKWKDVASLRRSMTDQNIKKIPGWSAIEVDKVMYRFVAGEKEGKLKEEANEKLREIMVRLRIEGYVPEVGPVLHDVEQEEKEDSMIRHSEKLAVAFGMARMAEGKTIRVVKNLRTCRDCHGVMKLISKVYRVEIVMRDRSRFHSFKDGSCSCRDYW